LDLREAGVEVSHGSFRLMSQFYRVGRSAALGLGHFAHRHSEAVGVCLGDLQTSGQGVAANPEGDAEHGQGEDEAGHGSFRFDAVSLQGQAATSGPWWTV